MASYIIELEGIDGCGKSTQAAMLEEKLNKLGYKTKLIKFPRYDKTSSFHVKKYLKGEYGNPEDNKELSPSAITLWFLNDMYISYIKEWSKWYNNDKYDILLFDRYVGSTILYQGTQMVMNYENSDYTKLLSLGNKFNADLCLSWEARRNAINAWIQYFAHDVLNLPKANHVLYLTIPPTESAKQRISRDGTSDIHEDNQYYLNTVHELSTDFALLNDWTIMDCYSKSQNKLYPIDVINQELLDLIEVKYNKRQEDKK